MCFPVQADQLVLGGCVRDGVATDSVRSSLVTCCGRQGDADTVSSLVITSAKYC